MIYSTFCSSQSFFLLIVFSKWCGTLSITHGLCQFLYTAIDFNLPVAYGLSLWQLPSYSNQFICRNKKNGLVLRENDQIVAYTAEIDFVFVLSWASFHVLFPSFHNMGFLFDYLLRIENKSKVSIQHINLFICPMFDT